MSMSTLSISSGSSLGSLGSLGSLSESSRGSLNSLGLPDYSSYSASGSNLQELHRRVEKLLQGHSISPIHESPVNVSPDVMAAATGGYLESVLGSSNQDIPGAMNMHGYTYNMQAMQVPNYSANVPSQSANVLNYGVVSVGYNMPSSMSSMPLSNVSNYSSTPVGSGHSLSGSAGQLPVSSASSHSSLTSMSPPISPYDVGPPPTYGQHMNLGVPSMSKPPPPYVPQGRNPSYPPPASASSNVNYLPSVSLAPSVPQVSSNQSKMASDDLTITPSYTQSKLDYLHNTSGALTSQNFVLSSQQHNLVLSSDPNYSSHIAKRILCSDGTELGSNPPLSPISETSSGVCNNLSGGNTRSVSAAVSDESVAGDSGVFDAVVKR